MDAEQLTLRKMTFDGIPYDDDWAGHVAGPEYRPHPETVRRYNGCAGVVLGYQRLRNAQPAHWKDTGTGLADC